jgi:hypothetical protein
MGTDAHHFFSHEEVGKMINGLRKSLRSLDRPKAGLRIDDWELTTSN